MPLQFSANLMKHSEPRLNITWFHTSLCPLPMWRTPSLEELRHSCVATCAAARGSAGRRLGTASSNAQIDSPLSHAAAAVRTLKSIVIHRGRTPLPSRGRSKA